MLLRAVGLFLALTTVGTVLGLVACTRPTPSSTMSSSVQSTETNVYRVGTGGISARGSGIKDKESITAQRCSANPCVVTVIFEFEDSKCKITTPKVVVLGKDVTKVEWSAIASSADYGVWFRPSTTSEKTAFGIRIHDVMDYSKPDPRGSEIWAPVASAPASAASWAYSSSSPAGYTKASAYDVYLQYQKKGDAGPTACDIYDPIIVNDGQ